MNAEFKPKIAAAADQESDQMQAFEREFALLRLRGGLQALYLLTASREKDSEILTIPADGLSCLFEMLADEAKRACPL